MFRMLHWVQEEKTVVPSKFRPYFPESILSRGMFIQSVIFPDACQVHAGNNGPCRSKHLTSQFHVGISISGGIWVGCADRYNIICYEGNQDQKSIFQNIKLWTKASQTTPFSARIQLQRALPAEKRARQCVYRCLC